MQLGKIVSTAVSAETAADFLFYLDFPHAPFTGIVVIRNMRVGEEGEQIVLDFKDTSLEFLKILIKVCEAL